MLFVEKLEESNFPTKLSSKIRNIQHLSRIEVFGRNLIINKKTKTTLPYGVVYSDVWVLILEGLS